MCFARSLRLWLEKEEVRQKGGFEGERCDWSKNIATDDAQSVEESTQVTEPVKQAISLPVDYKLVCTEHDFKTAEFVLVVRVFFGWKLVP